MQTEYLRETPDALTHYGTKGMKWYRRIYQNYDGSLTALGRLRYLKGDKSLSKAGEKEAKLLAQEHSEFATKYHSLMNKYSGNTVSMSKKDYKTAQKLKEDMDESKRRLDNLVGKVSNQVIPVTVKPQNEASKPSNETQAPVQQPKPEQPTSKLPYRAADPTTMTKQQLDDAVNYQKALDSYNKVFNPKQEKQASVGKKFIEHSWSKIIEPSLTNAAQKALEAKLKQEFGKKLGVNLNEGKKKDKKKED